MANLGKATQASPDSPLNKEKTPSPWTILVKQLNALLYEFDVCKRTLTVSKGYPTTREQRPPKPPATKFAFGFDLVRNS